MSEELPLKASVKWGKCLGDLQKKTLLEVEFGVVGNGTPTVELGWRK